MSVWVGRWMVRACVEIFILSVLPGMHFLVSPAGRLLSRAPPGPPRPRKRAKPVPRGSPRGLRRSNGP